MNFEIGKNAAESNLLPFDSILDGVEASWPRVEETVHVGQCIDRRTWGDSQKDAGREVIEVPSTTSMTATPVTRYFDSSKIGLLRTITDPPMLWPTNYYLLLV
jgi:hypothetical protein